VIQTPERGIAPPPGGTATAGSSTSFQNLNGSAPAFVAQSCHQRATGQPSTDHNKINILARHGNRWKNLDSEGANKKDGWRPVLILPKRFPEKNSVHTPYRVAKTHTP
jgi:hypothetical protein